MSPGRIKRLKERCYEQRIRMDQSRKDGKLVSDLSVTIDVYNILEEILEHLGKDYETY